jgi:hypothetical protein
MYIIDRFPRISLTRLKQCNLKKIDKLVSFGEMSLLKIQLIILYLDNNDLSSPFNGKDPKKQIIEYQLNKSLLDFRLVIWSEQTRKFLDRNIFCRSYELIECNYFLILFFFSFFFFSFLVVGKEYTNHRH